jgi:rod shape-determining protein MreD
MMQERVPRFVPERFTRTINRAPSPFLARAIPWVTIMLGSMLPTWPVIASAPLLPPAGFMMMLAWLQIRPGVLPIWAGLPLGLFDDIYSGQPFGSGILLWSLTMIALDVIETRIPWRNFAQEWLVAIALLAGYMLLQVAAANTAGAPVLPHVILPQLMLSILLYPLTGRVIALFDRLRLLPVVELD